MADLGRRRRNAHPYPLRQAMRTQWAKGETHCNARTPHERDSKGHRGKIQTANNRSSLDTARWKWESFLEAIALAVCWASEMGAAEAGSEETLPTSTPRYKRLLHAAAYINCFQRVRAQGAFHHDPTLVQIEAQA